ncbi:MAG TPA: hypothetical protein VNO35_06725 [Steroidobacteraceae bacterium]|nr:hypothetical protein [Steroidobacteraceae bacterium]
MNSGGAHVISNSMIARNNLFTPDNPFAEGIGAGLVANNTDPIQQTLALKN